MTVGGYQPGIEHDACTASASPATRTPGSPGRGCASSLPKTTRRLVNPSFYPVYLTPKLAQLQQQLIDQHRENK